MRTLSIAGCFLINGSGPIDDLTGCLLIKGSGPIDGLAECFLIKGSGPICEFKTFLIEGSGPICEFKTFLIKSSGPGSGLFESVLLIKDSGPVSDSDGFETVAAPVSGRWSAAAACLPAQLAKHLVDSDRHGEAPRMSAHLRSKTRFSHCRVNIEDVSHFNGLGRGSGGSWATDSSQLLTTASGDIDKRNFGPPLPSYLAYLLSTFSFLPLHFVMPSFASSSMSMLADFWVAVIRRKTRYLRM